MTANYDDVTNGQMEIPPIRVHIVSTDPTPEKRPSELRTAHRTIVLTATQPYAQIAGYDPARKEVYLNGFDNVIVLSGDISQASDANNLAAVISNPNGRLLNMSLGSEYCIPGQDEMWISAGVYPTKVGYTIVRRI